MPENPFAIDLDTGTLLQEIQKEYLKVSITPDGRAHFYIYNDRYTNILFALLGRESSNEARRWPGNLGAALLQYASEEFDTHRIWPL